MDEGLGNMQQSPGNARWPALRLPRVHSVKPIWRTFIELGQQPLGIWEPSAGQTLAGDALAERLAEQVAGNYFRFWHRSIRTTSRVHMFTQDKGATQPEHWDAAIN